MEKENKKNGIERESIIEVVSSENFGGLPENTQKLVLNSISTENSKDGGFMGKFFGNKKENAAMNIAFIICILFVIVGVVCMMFGHEIWSVIIPAIMTAVGYMFGVGAKDN